MFYVLEGELEFLVGDETVCLGEGSVAHFPPGAVHDLRNLGTRRARCLMISSPAGLDRYFDEMAELGASGTFSPDALQALRLKYDTSEVALSWSA